MDGSITYSHIEYTLPATNSPPLQTTRSIPGLLTVYLLHMAQQQKHRAPKLKTTQSADQESTLSITPEAISLDKDDHVVQEKQSYTMVTGLLQVMVHMHSSETRRLPADLSTRHQGGQHCLSTVPHMCCSLM